MPDVITTLAIAELLLLHAPPVVASLSIVARPTQTSETPVIDAGVGFTVTIVSTMHLPTEYTIIDVPAATPYTFPDTSTVAIPVLLLLHVPPPTASLKPVVPPMHNPGIPPIGIGSTFTVTTVVVEQPGSDPVEASV